jgi:CubicO group peptidase (beta-lactamase class C family)
MTRLTEAVLAPHAAELDALVARFHEESGAPGCSIGLVDDQELVWSRGLGVRAYEDPVRPDERTLFQIASITKTFTATAIVQLRDEGLLALDDPLVRHVPEFAAARNPFGPVEQVTLRGLLQHVSGLQGEVTNRDLREWTRLSTREVVADLGRVSVAVPPGTRVKYSNLGYQLLGEVVSRVSGQGLWDYLRGAILEPLGMHDTMPTPAGEAAARCARGYQARTFDDRPAEEPPAPAELRGEGAGALWSTVSDLARWVAQHLRAGEELERGDGQILRGESIAELQRPVLVADDRLQSTRGLGWFAERRSEAIVVGHAGLVDGFATGVSFCPEDRLGAVVLTNGSGSESAEFASRLLERVRPLARGAARAAEPPAPVPPEWRELLGEYRGPGLSLVMVVEVRRGELRASERSDDPWLETRLRPTGEPDCFAALDGRAAGDLVRVFRGADGAVEGLNFAGFPLVRQRPATTIASLY